MGLVSRKVTDTEKKEEITRIESDRKDTHTEVDRKCPEETLKIRK